MMNMLKEKKGMGTMEMIGAGIILTILLVFSVYSITNYIIGPIYDNVVPAVSDLTDGACKNTVNFVIATDKLKDFLDGDHDKRPDDCDRCTCSCDAFWSELDFRGQDTPGAKAKAKKTDGTASCFISYKSYTECIDDQNSDTDHDGIPSGCDKQPTVKSGIADWIPGCEKQVTFLNGKGQTPRCNLINPSKINPELTNPIIAKADGSILVTEAR